MNEGKEIKPSKKKGGGPSLPLPLPENTAAIECHSVRKPLSFGHVKLSACITHAMPRPLPLLPHTPKACPTGGGAVTSVRDRCAKCQVCGTRIVLDSPLGPIVTFLNRISWWLEKKVLERETATVAMIRLSR